VSAGSGPTVHIRNVDAPAVRVIAWSGADPVTVACGAVADISPKGAPQLPWNLAIYDAASNRQLFSKSVSNSAALYLLIRSTGILWGNQEPASLGPFNKGCH
jgi:hypothetical protein